MRPKTQKYIVTFQTTVAAMSMEDLAKKSETPGRLIPTPTSITASCGLAWMADPEDQTSVDTLIDREKIAVERRLRVLI